MTIKSFVLPYNDEIVIFLHKTKDITKVINEKCELIIAMNVSKTQLKKIAKESAKVYCLSSYADIDSVSFIQNHIKLYSSEHFVFFSSANLSLTSFPELTIRLRKTPPLSSFLAELEKQLSLLPRQSSRLLQTRFPVLPPKTRKPA